MTGSPYILRYATGPEIDYIRTLNAEMWAKDLDVETYHKRERVIGSVSLTRDGGIRSWVLVNPASDRPNEILSSCETIKKHALISRPPGRGETTAKVTDTMAHAIGSVFTPTEHRGRGYAGIMMSLLAEKLRRECKEGFSVLYSDIGKKFYAKHGWLPHPSTHIEFPVVETGSMEDARYLRSSDLPTLCAKDVDALRRKLQKPESHMRVACLPDWKTMEWHHAREEFVAPYARPNVRKKPEFKGAITADGKRWFIWNRDFMANVPLLYILRVANLSGESDPLQDVREIAKLFRAALHEAKKWGLERIVLWNPDEETVEAARRIMGNKLQCVERDTDSIPSLMMHTGDCDMKGVEWLGNEKYAWC